jgi:hypothetical protein
MKRTVYLELKTSQEQARRLALLRAVFAQAVDSCFSSPVVLAQVCGL